MDQLSISTLVFGKSFVGQLLGAKLGVFVENGDRLFPQVEAWDVEIPQTSDGRAKFMIRGYKRAADELVERALIEPAIKPILVYPIVYCYRQFVELSLKNQLHRFGNRAGLSLGRIMKSHDLKKLLSYYTKLDRNKATNALTQWDFGYLIGRIKEIHSIDPQSFSFRYPDSSDHVAEAGLTQKIDLANIRNVMAKIANLLEFADEELEGIFADLK